MTSRFSSRAVPWDLVLARLLDVREGETRSILPALAFSFLSVGAHGLAQIASDTLFVSVFSLGQLSSFYVAVALLRVAVSFGYASLSGPRLGARVDVALLIASAITMAGGGLLAHSSSKPILYLVCLAQVILPPILPLASFNAAMGSFHARQAKRLLPLVAAAATVGTIAVGALASLSSRFLGTSGLLFAGAALALVASPLPSVLASRDHDEPPTTLSAPSLRTQSTVREMVRDLRELPVVRLLVANAAMAAALTIWIDFAFKSSLKARYSQTEMATYLGVFTVVSNALVLAAQLFFTSRFVSRFGIGAALRVPPAALVLVGPMFALAPGVASSSAGKLADTVLRFALGGTIADLLLTPTSAGIRTRAKIIVKAVASPVGALGAGVVLALFGAAGPPAWVLGLVIMATAGALFAVLSGARGAYTNALVRALGDRRASLDVSPASAAVLREEIVRILSAAVAESNEKRALGALALMGDRLFSLSDLAPALTCTMPAARAAALELAPSLARSGDAERLISFFPESADASAERDALAAARALGAKVDRARLERAIARGESGDDDASTALWAAGCVALTLHEPDAAVKKLRRAARDAKGSRRRAALRALGDLVERRAEPEVLGALSDPDVTVFAEAARAAVKIGATGAIPTLVAELRRGTRIRAASRALSLAGPAAVDALLAELPTTRGEGGPATAVADAHHVAGTVRAARVLARLGPTARARVLERYEELGYRARNAIARALAGATQTPEGELHPALVTGAIEVNLRYAERLLGASAFASQGFFAQEIARRTKETSERVLDLAGLIVDRTMIDRARAGLSRPGRSRAHALELLEQVLPSSLAARAVGVLEQDPRITQTVTAETRLDGWLEKCRRFEAGTLPSQDPMSAVLEKLLVLREASLFSALSGEELYPVGEIAEALTLSAGDQVVKQGDAGDALFVVGSGTFSVSRDGVSVRALGPGDVFGEMALLDGSPRSASVKAETDGTLLRIPRLEFEVLLDESPELSRGVIRTLLGHLRGST